MNFIAKISCYFSAVSLH